MTIEEALAKNIKKRSKERKLTVRGLCRLSGVSCTCISAYMNTKNGATLSRVYFIAKALGCTIDDLLEGCDE